MGFVSLLRGAGTEKKRLRFPLRSFSHFVSSVVTPAKVFITSAWTPAVSFSIFHFPSPLIHSMILLPITVSPPSVSEDWLKPQIQGAILYKGLEHAWILVFMGILEPVSPQILRDSCTVSCSWSETSVPLQGSQDKTQNL